MSNIYIHEPPTIGKVLLHTSVGDIDIELWSKEAPKACRNFVQLCLEGYYDNTIFHRVVKGFIAQCGDPTGTGHGGESVYGKTFRDEFHSRLRFVRRGLVAMANAGPDDNGSQFFFTFASAPELDRKHTIFGKIAGATLYNMLKLEDLEVNSDDRPAYPPTINKTKVLLNPFEDIVPRSLPKRKKEGDEPKKKRNKSRATKNFSLLSFGEEAEEDEEEVNKVSQDLRTKSKSSHDLVPDDSLSSVPAVDGDAESSPEKASTEEKSSPSKEPSSKRSHDESNSNVDDSSDDEEKKKEKEATMERIRKKLKKDDSSTNKQSDTDANNKDVVVKHKETSEVSNSSKDEQLSKIDQLKKQAKQLKKEIQGAKMEKEPEPEQVEAKKPKVPQNEVITAYEEERRKYEDRKLPKKSSKRQSETLAILAKFQSRLSAARSLTAYDDDKEEEEEKEEKEEEDDPNDLSWMNHKLNFEISSKKVLDANIQDDDRYEIFDPRNPMVKRRREASKQAMKEKR